MKKPPRSLAERLTRRWMRIESGPSPCAGERAMARDIGRWARESSAGFRIRVRPVPADPHRRESILITLPGGRAPGVLLMGHLDTVGVADFGALRKSAGDPDRLEAVRPMGVGWLQGRGALDMKSGLAAGAEALSLLAGLATERRAGPVALLVTPDEENSSLGVQAGRGWKPLTETRWALALSLDFVPPPPAPAAGRLYWGTIGKCLAGILFRVPPAHAAELRRFPSSVEWAAETVRRFTKRRFSPGVPGPAPLRARDLKAEYDTQLPREFLLYFNVLAYPLEPARVLSALASDARAAWKSLGAGALGRDAVGAVHLSAAKCPPGEAGWDAAERQVRAAGGPDPGASLFFAPPYYASRSAPATGSPARAALERVARRERLWTGECYPYISDVSFLGPAQDAAFRAWRDACPLESPAAGIGPSIPLATLGPWGQGAHGPTEAVRAEYALERLPRILVECVREIWRSA